MSRMIAARVRLVHVIQTITTITLLLIQQTIETSGAIVTPPTHPPFQPAPIIPPERTAYVGIHYHDYETSQLSQLDSATAFEGIRTMMAGVADPAHGNSQRDRVVLVPVDTPESVRATYKNDGLIVLEMDSSLPHHDICAPKFDRIYLWSNILASRYDRIIYLDWDVLVQRNMDHLFLCGEFCLVYNSILHFVDGIMVVKPNPAVFDQMVWNYKFRRSNNWQSPPPPSNRIGMSDQLTGLTAPSSWVMPSSKTTCWENSYLFFLEKFGNIEAAPLFNAKYGQSPLPLQRLDASVQLNAMMWYEKYTWVLMRSSGYRNMTEDIMTSIPALSLGFTTLKPFHWGPALFFNLGWMWSDVRDQYLHKTHHGFIITRLLLWIAYFFLATKGLRKFIYELYRRRTNNSGVTGKVISFIRAFHLKLIGPTDGWIQSDASDELVYLPTTIFSLSGYWLPRYGSDLLGIVLGSLQALGLMYCMTWYTLLIPILTQPLAAWRIWCLFHVLGIYAFNHWLFLAYHGCPPLLAGPTEPKSPHETNELVTRINLPPFPFLSTISYLATWELILYWSMQHATWYPEFVVKMFVMFPLMAAILISAININRQVWKSIEQAKKGGQMNKESANVQMPLLPLHNNRT